MPNNANFREGSGRGANSGFSSSRGGSFSKGERGGFRPKAQPKVVKDLLSGTFSKFGIDQQLSRYGFVLEWESIVGVEIALRSKPHAVERGVLTIRVVNSEWAQELAFQKELLLARIAKYGENSGNAVTASVKDIRFVVGAL